MSRRSPRLPARFRLSLPVAVLALLGGLFQPAPAQTLNASVSVRPASGPVGTVFRFRGSGYDPKETISTVVRWPDGTDEADVLFQADDRGDVDFQWDSRGAVPGRYTATATGATSGRSASAPFVVQ